MSHVLCYLSGALTLLLLPFCLHLFLLAVFARAARRRLHADQGGAVGPAPTARFLIVIPAHDEAAGIQQTVAGCLAMDYPRERFAVWVVADNCSDDTERLAREAGAQVLRRTDESRRSKGHALEFFFTHALADPELSRADAAVVIDADTRCAEDLLAHFAAALGRGRKWLQAYDTIANPEASWRTRLMTYAFALYNGTWLLGQERLGLSVGLRGNGMCFALPALRRQPFCTYGLVEDVEFGWRLRLRGERAHFVPQARVYATMLGPRQDRGGAAAGQRLRWEVGRRQLRALFRRPLLTAPGLRPAARLLYLLDLHSPPLARLGAALLLAIALGLAGGPLLHLAQAVLLLCLGAYLVSPFLVMGLPWRFARSLLHAPRYALWKALLLFKKKPAAWVRTARE